MARSIWKGNFKIDKFTPEGNVVSIAIPTKLYKARESKSGTGLNLICPQCNGKVSQLYACPNHPETKLLQRAELKKGFESGGAYVEVTELDLDSVKCGSLKSIEVIGFTDQPIDCRLTDDIFYLSADKTGEQPFLLFVKAMEATQTKCIAKLTMRDREHIVAISPMENLLLVQSLVYAEEVRAYDELNVQANVTNDMVELGKKIIETMKINFNAEQYTDHYKEAFNAMIASKLSGEVVQVAEDIRPTPAKDMVSTLMALAGVK